MRVKLRGGGIREEREGVKEKRGERIEGWGTTERGEGGGGDVPSNHKP